MNRAYHASVCKNYIKIRNENIVLFSVLMMILMIVIIIVLLLLQTPKILQKVF